jgi:hypothetical protein
LFATNNRDAYPYAPDWLAGTGGGGNWPSFETPAALNRAFFFRDFPADRAM